MEADDAPERVKLQIVLPGMKAAKQTVRVVGKSRDHEKCVFEEEGFVFKRARRTPPPSLPPMEAPAAPAAAAAAAAVQAGSLDQIMPDAAAPADQLPAAAQQLQVEGQQQLAQQQQHIEPGAPLGPLRFTMAASELAYLVQWVLSTELRLKGGTSGAAAADSTAAAAGPAESPVAQVVGDRVAAALLQRGESGKEGQAEVAGGEPATVALAPAVVLPFQVARLKARLSEKRDWLLRVEKAWDEVEARYSVADAPQAPDAGTAAEGEAAAAVVVEEEDGAAAAAPGEGSATAARAAAIARMELQADEMEALVAKVELAAAEAETVATALQARFHSARFSLYPHVNSPALLIKSLIRAPKATATAAPADAADA